MRVRCSPTFSHNFLYKHFRQQFNRARCHWAMSELCRKWNWNLGETLIRKNYLMFERETSAYTQACSYYVVHIDCETVQSVIVITERKKTYVHNIGCLNESAKWERWKSSMNGQKTMQNVTRDYHELGIEVISENNYQPLLIMFVTSCCNWPSFCWVSEIVDFEVATV